MAEKPATYQVIRNGRILDFDSRNIDNADILIKEDTIKEIETIEISVMRSALGLFQEENIKDRGIFERKMTEIAELRKKL